MSEQNYRVFWEEALKQIHDEYKEKGLEDDFKLWFNMEYVKDSISTITVSIPSEFMWKTMNDKGFVLAVQNKINELTGQKIDLNYIVTTHSTNVENNQNIKNKNKVNFSITSSASIKFKKNNDIEKEKKQKKHPQLREDY